MTYSKTPSNKGLSDLQIKEHCKTLGKDSVTVEIRDNGKYRLNLARRYSRMYYQASSNKRFDTKLSVLDSNGKLDKTNADAIAAIVTEMHNDLTYRHFDKELYKYGLKERPALTAIDGGKTKPQMSVLEVYDMYCEYVKPDLAKTTYELKYRKLFLSSIKEAIDNTSENALDIRNYLRHHKCLVTTKNCLRLLEKAYQLAIKHRDKTGITDNPFNDIALGIKKDARPDNDLNEDLDDTKAFSVDEMNTIIEAFESSGYRRHYAPIIKFLFWTGCRTGEAIGLKWKDIKWEKERIVFNRTYNGNLKIFKETKTETIRFFPMPKDGQLWNLLKSIPEKELEDVVFMSKNGNISNAVTLGNVWRGNEKTRYPGVIPELVKQGKVSQYLKLYATRHTFVSHEINIYGTPDTTVAAWVGHDASVSRKSYLDRDRITLPGNAGVPKQEETTNNQSDNFEQLLNDLTPEQIEKLKAKLFS